MDIKAMYQERAEELALELLHSEFYDLHEDTRRAIYQAAEEMVNDELVSQAEARGDAMEAR